MFFMEGSKSKVGSPQKDSNIENMVKISVSDITKLPEKMSEVDENNSRL